MPNKEKSIQGQKQEKKKDPLRNKLVPRLQKEKKDSFYIAGIGTSAGGLEGIEQFFINMPVDSGLAFVLVPHLDPTHISILPDLIQKYTEMSVIRIKDGTKVEPNCVYVIPPNKDMAMLHGVLQLIDPVKTVGPRLPIDYFFRSLAVDQQEKSIGIILSGMGTDGTLGLRAIKGELGMAMVSDPQSAKYDSMPRSAIETGLMDYILAPKDMPKQLIAYTKYALNHAVPLKNIPVEGKVPDALQKIFILLRSHTGHDFSSYKHNTICRRIERRMNVHQIEHILEYVRYLQENPPEIENLFKELLIGVTNFFRDPEAFEALKQTLLPLLKDKPNNYSLRIWIAGCSTGEEAYSIAIILAECMIELKQIFNVQIFATDIDNTAVDIARAGVYPVSISADLTPERLKQFFVSDDSSYRIKKNIREMLIFAPQDILKDPPFTKLDLLCCRNLLIYLDAEVQKKLLPLFHYSLKPNGLLFLGSAESVGEFTDIFSGLDKKNKIFRREDTASAIHPIMEFPLAIQADRGAETQAAKTTELNISQLTQNILLETYAPPSVVINSKGDILYISGRTGKYLEPPPGKPSINILEMARDGLKMELPSAIRNAIVQKKKITYEGLLVKNNGDSELINLTVRPLSEKETEANQGLLLVGFEKVPSPPASPAKPKHGLSKHTSKRIEEIENELQYTKEHLQTTIEELETSNEELKSTNEELQSTNEELQSANEELETSKEEQQSLNEELVTVNTELQGKIDELSKANNDMKNLLDSIEVPTIFLDNNLNIKRFTSHATKVINLINTDIGRSITHLVANLKYTNLVEDAESVLKTLVYREIEVETTEGYWYLMRIMPYRTIDNTIEGVVITFLDVHKQKTATKEIQELYQTIEEAYLYAEGIANTVSEPLIVLNSNLHVILANRSFYKTFQVTLEEIKGEIIYNLCNQQWDSPGLHKLLELLPKNNFLGKFEVDYGQKKMVLNARRVVLPNSRKILAQEVGGEIVILSIAGLGTYS